MDFNPQQRAAIESTARNLLVLAGAGTGKTRTIIGRAHHLMNRGVDPRRIAILTFTRRSANEIRHRLQQMSGGDSTSIVAGTFHHFCLRQMSSRRSWFGYEEATLLDRDDQLQLMKLVRGQLVGKKSIVPQAAELVNYYSYARNTNQPVREYLERFVDQDSETLDEIEKIFEGYRDRKRTGNYLDYDDILYRFAAVMKEDKDVRAKIAGSFDHLLVDEMQDTNPLQWLILEAMAEHANLFCVGDDAQSIYAFRGADFENVHSFSQRLPNAVTQKLELNYRSTQEILDLANWVLDQSPLKYGKHLEAHRGKGSKPALMEFPSEFEEADWVTDSLIERHRQGAAWHDHMILCRSAYSARPIEAGLIERKIPYRFIGGIGLLQMAHIRDVMSALRVAVNQYDELAAVRYLTLWQRIGEVSAARLVAQIKQAATPEEAIKKLAQELKRPEVTDPLNDALKHFERPAAAVEKVAEALEQTLANKYDRWENRKRDLILLERLAKEHNNLREFLDAYTLDPVSISEAQQDEDDVVTLITVHSAKGTEAPVCYVAAANQGNYPHSRNCEDEAGIEEERRVLYVALTRAQNELIISRSSGGGGRFNWQAAVAPYFLERLPAKLIHREIVNVRKGRSNYWDERPIR